MKTMSCIWGDNGRGVSHSVSAPCHIKEPLPPFVEE